MKLKAGKDEYPMPQVGLIERVLLDRGVRKNPNIWKYCLTAISFHRYADLRGDPAKPALTGVPTSWAYANETLYIWPAPAEDWELNVAYYPPLVML